MKFFLLFTLVLSSLALNACTTRELAVGAAAGAAGYIIGEEAREDD
mgnify:CR=1 FL=1